MADGLRIEGPGPGTKREDAGVCVEYLGVRVIIAPRMTKPRDRGVWVLVNTEDVPRGVEVEFEVTDRVVVSEVDWALAGLASEVGHG